MIAAFPFNATLCIADFSQPSGEFIDAGGLRHRQDRFDVGNAIEALQAGREYLRRIGRPDERIVVVWMSQQIARDYIDAAAGGSAMERTGEKLPYGFSA